MNQPTDYSRLTVSEKAQQMFTPLIIFIALAVVTLAAIEIRERQRQKTSARLNANKRDNSQEQEQEQEQDNKQQKQYSRVMPDGSVCCGLHLVCERESLLNTDDTIVYYEDEELDRLKGIRAEDYTPEQAEAVAEVFRTMKAEDVPGWLRSLQLRQIEIPLELRDEVLMIVREQRAKKAV